MLVCEGDRVVGMLGGVQAIGFNTDVRDRPRLRVETIEFTLGTA